MVMTHDELLRVIVLENIQVIKSLYIVWWREGSEFSRNDGENYDTDDGPIHVKDTAMFEIAIDDYKKKKFFPLQHTN